MAKKKYYNFIVEYENDEIFETEDWRAAFVEFNRDKNCLGVYGRSVETGEYQTILWHD